MFIEYRCHFTCVPLMGNRLPVVATWWSDSSHPQTHDSHGIINPGWSHYDGTRVYREHRSALHWRHNDRDGVSNHQPHGCLLNRLFRRRSKKTSKLRVTGLCVGNSPRPMKSPHTGPVTRKMFPFDNVIMELTHLSGAKWPPFRRRHVQMRFHEWKVWYFGSNFIEVCS